MVLGSRKHSTNPPFDIVEISITFSIISNHLKTHFCPTNSAISNHELLMFRILWGEKSFVSKTFVKFYDGFDVLPLILVWPFKEMEQVHIKRDNMGELTKSQ